jgi:hypothetical protein
MWAGIIENRLIGIHVLPPHLNGEGYLNFLQNELSDLLDDVPLRVRRDMWYLHDGAPAHSARGALVVMDQFYGQLIHRTYSIFNFLRNFGLSHK